MDPQQTYICYHGNQYSFLQHILPENKVSVPLENRPTIKAQSRNDIRNMEFINTPEKINNQSLFSVRGTGPYALYSQSIDTESMLRTLNQPLNECSQQRYTPSINSSLYTYNTISNPSTSLNGDGAPLNYHIEHQKPECIKEQYQLENNMRRFNNATRNSKYVQ